MRNFLQYYDVNKNFKLLLQNLLLIPENFLIYLNKYLNKYSHFIIIRIITLSEKKKLNLGS